MPADMYSDAPEQSAPPGKEAAPEQGGDSATAVLPKSILAGKEFKPGDEVVLRIVALHDDEVEVAYASEEGGGKGEGEPEGGGEEATAPAQSGGMSSMYE